MNFVQKKRKQHAAGNDFLDLHLTAGFDDKHMNKRDSFAGSECENRSEFGESRTMATAGNSSSLDSGAFVAITTGRGQAQSEVGIAFYDVERPSVKLIQFSDDAWYTGLLTKMNILQPAQAIVPQTIHDARIESIEGKLMKYLRDQFPTMNFIKIPRRHFSDSDGIQLIRKFCAKNCEHSIDSFSTKYYALSSVAALLKYLQFSLHLNFGEKSLKIEFEMKFGHLLMDIETTQRLELLSIDGQLRKTHSALFDYLNQCVTFIGKRTLRGHILEPLCDLKSILQRHECIEELNVHRNVQLKILLRDLLRRFNHIDRLYKLALIAPQDDNIRAAEILISQTIELRSCLQHVPALRKQIESLQSKMFREIFVSLTDQRYRLMFDHIDSVLDKDFMTFRCDGWQQIFQRVNCIRSGNNQLIDVMRNIFNELIKELNDLVGNLSTRFGQVFKLQYNLTHQFHMRLIVSAGTTESDIPTDLDVLELKRNYCLLSSTEMKKLNIRLSSVVEEITIQSNVILSSTLTQIREEIDAVYDLSGIVAILDVIVSLATVSSFGGFVRPQFGDEMRLVDGIHPLLDRNVLNTVAVPNNVIGTPEYNFFVITGPNMSGKTIYLKMIATLQIMAQLGCFVPAKSAQFRIADRIFTRIGANDSIEKNASSFVVEARKMEMIFQNVTSNSLILIDELFRSTNPTEGAKLAWNCCEHLISLHGTCTNAGEFYEQSIIDNNENDTKLSSTVRKENELKIIDISAPFIYLTTHYTSLTQLTNCYFNVVNLCFNADEHCDANGMNHMKFNHRIGEGVTINESYGLKLAETVRFPTSIISKAKEIYRELETQCDFDDVECNDKRRCSSLSRKMHPNDGDVDRMSTTPSVVAKIMTKSNQISKNDKAISSTMNSVKTNSTINQKRLRFDQILYNLYGDLASILRHKEIDSTEKLTKFIECLQTFGNECDETTFNFIIRADAIELQTPENATSNEFVLSERNEISSPMYDENFHLVSFDSSSMISQQNVNIFDANFPPSATALTKNEYINSYRQFDLVGLNVDNNSNGKYAQPFKSIRSASKLCKSNLTEHREYGHRCNSIDEWTVLNRMAIETIPPVNVANAAAEQTMNNDNSVVVPNERIVKQKHEHKVVEHQPKSLDLKQLKTFDRLYRFAVNQSKSNNRKTTNDINVIDTVDTINDTSNGSGHFIGSRLERPSAAVSTSLSNECIDRSIEHFSNGKSQNLLLPPPDFI